jgi:hypothetical protein
MDSNEIHRQLQALDDNDPGRRRALLNQELAAAVKREEEQAAAAEKAKEVLAEERRHHDVLEGDGLAALEALLTVIGTISDSERRLQELGEPMPWANTCIPLDFRRFVRNVLQRAADRKEAAAKAAADALIPHEVKVKRQLENHLASQLAYREQMEKVGRRDDVMYATLRINELREALGIATPLGEVIAGAFNPDLRKLAAERDATAQANHDFWAAKTREARDAEAKKAAGV